MRKHHGRMPRSLLLVLSLSLVAACGASPAATGAPSSPVAMQPTDTPAPTRTAAELATRTAAPHLQPPVAGDLADFFIATIAGREAEARAFLAPGAYARVPNLRAALGLPQSSGPYMIDSLPLSATDDRANVRTVIAYAGHRFQEVVTLVKVDGRWKVEAVVPEGAQRPAFRAVTLRHAPVSTLLEIGGVSAAERRRIQYHRLIVDQFCPTGGCFA